MEIKHLETNWRKRIYAAMRADLMVLYVLASTSGSRHSSDVTTVRVSFS